MAKYLYLSETERKLLNECSYDLTLPIEKLTMPSNKNPNKTPRPQNHWIIFRKDCEANIRLRDPNVKKKIKDTARECSLKWKLQTSEVKHFFRVLEKIARENHKRIFPGYKYKKYKSKSVKDPKYQKFININQTTYIHQDDNNDDMYETLFDELISCEE
ncbi:9181_t:CDS:1 [Ambispora gerdemannii]|uniref:9181_t:CDS:1 n=1 Tax=Ambispora gerdemannii TaxID=144530 RepID=A0A9N8ZCW4_9GLOM|nr:9181_t:CDS:1 [Ambispora gerdemannii]